MFKDSLYSKAQSPESDIGPPPGMCARQTELGVTVIFWVWDCVSGASAWPAHGILLKLWFLAHVEIFDKTNDRGLWVECGD